MKISTRLVGWFAVCPLAALTFMLAAPARADDATLPEWLSHAILGADLPLREATEYAEQRVVQMPEVKSLDDWEAHAQHIRREMFERVVFRGEAARWRETPTRVEWLDTIDGGPGESGVGYKIRKLRLEVVPSLWIPALLYVPDKLEGKVPVVMNVNGHDANGKAADYKQIRCINQAKRGMLALNLEWFGMGQLRHENFAHGRMNQLDLCGTSGLSIFYLAMQRGLDILLADPHADPARVAVAGLSGGGWQTIYISSLDPRVTLSNPVAGYSSFRTRTRHGKDLGDSEQTPVDMAAVADYSHLTALRAPRPTLLTYNAKDDCCFESGYALPPLLEAATPIYKLYDKTANLREHVNHDPGTHNFFQENREALYAMFRDFFSPADSPYSATEIECAAEVKTAAQLDIDLPFGNGSFHSLAEQLARELPRQRAAGKSRESLEQWQRAARGELAAIVRSKSPAATAREIGREEKGSDRVVYWQLRVGDAWTVPVVELARGEPKRTVILVADGGRASAVAPIAKLLDEGVRVLAVDPFYMGESKIGNRDYLYALFVSGVGDRPLGVQADQIGAVARWVAKDRSLGASELIARGPRTSAMALVAAALEPDTISAVRVNDSYGSLKQVIEENLSFEKAPELFCFGLLERFDIAQLVALVVPREARFEQASDRVRAELASIIPLYRLHASAFDPVVSGK